jgi:hypothetical protein
MKKLTLVSLLSCLFIAVLNGCGSSEAASRNEKNYVLSGNIPTTTVNGVQYEIAATVSYLPIGNLTVIGIFTGTLDNALQIVQIHQYFNAGELYNDVQAHGGITQYITWLVNTANQGFTANGIAAVFSVPSSVSTVPVTDDASALAAIRAWINAGSFNGSSTPPVSSTIPPQMTNDYNAILVALSARQTGYSSAWCGGQLTKMGDSLLLFADPSGMGAWLSPATDLAKLASVNPYAKTCFAKQYGFSA